MWPIGEAACPSPQPSRHKTLAERAACAARLVRDYGLRLPVCVAGLDGGLEDALAAWPTRYYVVGEGGRLRHVPSPSDCSYDLGELLAWMTRLR